MAYQPKYAAKGKRKPMPRTEEFEQPEQLEQQEAFEQPEEWEQPVQRVKPPKKKKSVLSIVLTVLLTLVIVPVSTWLTAKLMVQIFENVGRPKAAAVERISERRILRNFEDYVNAAWEEFTVAETKPQQNVPDPGTGNPVTPEPEETRPPRKQYRLEDNVKVAPKPNQNYFGETKDPTSLQWLLDEAKWNLEGQKLFFHTGVTLFADSKVMYYLDDSIFAITWKEVRDDSVYTFSEVKVSDPSQFRRHLADGEFGSDKQYMTTEMAESVNAVVASSGDFYRFRDFGVCVYEGKVRRVEGTYAETCMVDRSGNLHFVRGGEITTTSAAQKYVEENDIQFSLCFGPILVDDYQEVDHSWYGVGEINEGYARAALCQMDDLHYIVVTANTEGPHQSIPTVSQFRKNILDTGCKMAYCLDGGQTAAIVMNNQLINRPVYGTQRKISDIIFFATAVPEGE